MSRLAAAPSLSRRPWLVAHGWASGLARHWLGYAVLGLLGLLVGAPVVAVLAMSFQRGLPGRATSFTLANYQTAYADPTFLPILGNTLLFACGTVVVTLFFAIPLVWLFNRTDMPFKLAFFVLLIAGFLVPVFLRAIGWMLLFSPEIGLANQAARALFGLSQPPFSLYNIPGMAVVQGLSLVPASVFMLSAAFQNMDPALEEASFTSGAGRVRTLLRINLPLAWPAIAAVMIYMFMLAVSLFEVPAVIGWPARIFVLSALIYFAVTPSVGLPSYGLAGAYGGLMIALGLALAALYFRVVRETRRYAVITGRGYRPRLLRLGRWKYPALAFAGLFVALELALPLLALLWVSLLPHVQAPSLEALRNLTLANYLAIPDLVGLRPFVNTAILVALAPSLAIVLSVLVSWVVVRQPFPLRQVVDTLAFLPHAVPHILFAVAGAYLALVFRDLLPIYGTIFILALAHGVAYLAYGSRTLNGAMVQVHRELEESGRVCGSSSLRVLRRIVLPLIAAAVFNAWVWISLLSYREVTMALVLRSADNTVLATLIWELWTSGRAPEVGALGVVLIAAVVALAWLARGLFTRIVQWRPAGD